MKPMTFVLMLLTAVLSVAPRLDAQNRIDWKATDASLGGPVTDGIHSLYMSAGQPAVGVSSGSGHVLHSGFLYVRLSPANAPSLNVQTDLDFASTPPNTPLTRDLLITNSGSAALMFTAQTVNGTSFSLLTSAPGPVASGASATARLEFRPASLGDYAGTFTIRSNDPQRPVIIVTLHGVCAITAARITFDRDTVNFRTVAVGGSADEQLTVRNEGTAALVLSQQIITGSDAAQFTLLQAATSPIAAGSNSVVRIRHRPTSAGMKRAILRFATNDPAKPQADVVLRSDAIVGTDEIPFPRAVTLHQNHPNPFTDATTIAYDLRAPADVRLSVLDALGREVALLAHARAEAGTHAIVWSADDLPAGMYHCRIEVRTVPTGVQVVVVRPMVLLR
jgi:hypothetical protein